MTRDFATLKYGIQLASLLPHIWYVGRIFQRRLDSSTGNKLVLEDNDASRFVDVARTKDWRFITLNVNSKTSSEAGVVTTSVRCSEEHRVFHWEFFYFCLLWNLGKGGSAVGARAKGWNHL